MSERRRQSRLEAALREATALAESGRLTDPSKQQKKVAYRASSLANQRFGGRQVPAFYEQVDLGATPVRDKIAGKLEATLGGGPSCTIQLPRTSHYAQWAPARRGVYVELSANQHLEREDMLTPGQAIALGALGWLPADKLTPNHWFLIKTDAEVAGAANAILLAMLDVVGLPMGDLVEALADV